jgi:tetratricopeptide (TPR) repeat protein
VIRATAVVCALCGVAAAQSKTYPPKPVDKDLQDEQRSKVWESTLHPERHTYSDLVAKAKAALDMRSPDQTKIAIDELDKAIEAVPTKADAYRLRGDAYLSQQQWAKCADDFAAADAHAQASDATHAQVRRKLGLCQGRAGRLAAAEQTLAQAAATGVHDSELWMRLGETRIAMGKLDEAIEALKTAADTADPGTQALIQWLLAAAYDRAREPTESADAVRRAAGADRSFSTIVNPPLPFLGAGEAEYMLALAYTAEPARPEYTLVYFRRFLALAPDSPWKRRAAEHVRDLATADLPDSVEKRGAAPVEAEALRAVARKGMPALRACLAHHDGLVLEVKVTKVGPRSADNARDRPRIWAPPPGIFVAPQTDLTGDPRNEMQAAVHCVEPLVGKLPWPEVKERDSWYVGVFLVVAP